MANPLVTIVLGPRPEAIKLFRDMSLAHDFFDAAALWRDTAMKQTLHSGQLIDHPRTRDVKSL